MLSAKVNGLFDQIFVIPCGDGCTNMIILTGYKGGNNLYTDVSMALQTMDHPNEFSELWIPQFKLEKTIATDAICGLTASSGNYI